MILAALTDSGDGLLEANTSTKLRFLRLERWIRRLVRVLDGGVRTDREV